MKHYIPSLPLMHSPHSTSLLSVFNPITILNIPFGQFFNSVSASSNFYLTAFETVFFPLFLMLLHLFLFSSVLFQHIAMCASLFYITSFTSSFHHHVSPLLPLLLLYPYISSHTPKTPSLKCPSKYQCKPIQLFFPLINSLSSSLPTKLSFFSQHGLYHYNLYFLLFNIYYN